MMFGVILIVINHVNLGNTYLADRLNYDGSTIESSLDHTYLSANLVNNVLKVLFVYSNCIPLACSPVFLTASHGLLYAEGVK